MQDVVFVSKLLNEVSKVLVGQRYVLERMLIGLLSGGHILIESFPGLAKTLAVKNLSSAIQADYKRIQFIPGLLSADIAGTFIYNSKSSDFVVKIPFLRI
jgi:MoxR-like ATPase